MYDVFMKYTKIKCNLIGVIEGEYCPYNFEYEESAEGCIGYKACSPHGERASSDGIPIFGDYRCINAECVTHEIVSLNNRGKFEFDSAVGIVLNKNYFPIDDIDYLKIVCDGKETILIDTV